MDAELEYVHFRLKRQMPNEKGTICSRLTGRVYKKSVSML